MALVCEPVAEVCNSIDDDCDLAGDEEVPLEIDERTGLTWSCIPAGTFIMGSDPDDVPCSPQRECDAEWPPHEVTIRSFWLTTTEGSAQEQLPRFSTLRDRAAGEDGLRAWMRNRKLFLRGPEVPPWASASRVTSTEVHAPESRTPDLP